MFQQPRGFLQFIFKSLLFSILFIILTGIIGSIIIPTKLLYPYYFFIYGNLGKLVIFSVILFVLFTKDTIKKITYIPYDKKQCIFTIIGFLLVPVFYVGSQKLLQTKSFSDNLPLSLGMHMLAISMVVLITLGVFGIQYVRYFIKTYKKVLLYCLSISVVFYFSIFQVWKLWPYFSFIVLKAVVWLLSLSFSPVLEIPPRTIFVDNFTVAIEQACSGVDSLFLFSSLYIIIGALDWKRLYQNRFIFLFIPAILGLFLVNIVRVYLLLLTGIFLSPDIMMKLFHNYIGMIFFIMYFGIFYKFSYKLIYK